MTDIAEKEQTSYIFSVLRGVLEKDSVCNYCFGMYERGEVDLDDCLIHMILGMHTRHNAQHKQLMDLMTGVSGSLSEKPPKGFDLNEP